MEVVYPPELRCTIESRCSGHLLPPKMDHGGPFLVVAATVLNVPQHLDSIKCADCADIDNNRQTI